MIGRLQKGSWPAVTDIERIGFSRLRLYELYERDDAIREELIQLHDEWWSRIGRDLHRLEDCLPDLDNAERHLADLVGRGPAHDYFEAVGLLAAEAGLDRIPKVGTPPLLIAGYLPSGIAQAHRFLWRLDEALRWEAAPAAAREQLRPVRRPTFVALASFGAPIPAVDTSIAETNARWDPRTELLADARRRLRRGTNLPRETVEAELTRLTAEGGYQFPDTSTQRSGIWRLDRDAQWVWWRIRRRWSYAQIAAEWERLYPGDIQLQAREDDLQPRGDDKAARESQVDVPHEPWLMTTPAEAVGLVRKAVTTFARRAQVDVKTGPGRRADPAARAIVETPTPE